MININPSRQLRVAFLVATMTLVSACNTVPARLPVLDHDNDSVADTVDACLQTPRNSPVDEDGCSLFRGSIKNVAFEPGDHQLNTESRDSLAELVELLNEHPEVVLQIEGHTDNRGSAKDNLALSKRRVMAVTRYLVANEVDGARLKPFGFGENRPIKSNATAIGRSENRRIEMSVFTQ